MVAQPVKEMTAKNKMIKRGIIKSKMLWWVIPGILQIPGVF
jgi:hypothetical protein